MSHTFDSTILRAYDIRGIYGKTLFEDDAYWVGRTFGHCVRERGGKTIVVGRDGRLSSPSLSERLIQGLVEAGIDVLNIGIGPTPMSSFAGYELEADACVMLTGSHNPGDYNGFKMSVNNKPFFEGDIQRLGTLALSGDVMPGNGFVQDINISERYITRLLKDFPKTSDLKIVWDPGHGAGAEIISNLVKQLPGTHIVINGHIDGTFPAHHPDPTMPENLVQLQEEVARTGADAGFAFDGDADRFGAVDAKGRILWGDQIVMLLSRDILKSTPGATIIADVKASLSLFQDIESQGGVSLMWKTGHSHIKSKMRETGAILAGEMSGHIFIADDYYGFDDGIYAAVRFLKMMIEAPQPLTQICDTLPQMLSTPEIRFDCPETRKFHVPEEIKTRLESANANFSDVDGVRVSTQDGWWLIRASNTQDVLVARCEAYTQTGLNETINHLLAELELSQISSGEGVESLLKYRA